MREAIWLVVTDMLPAASGNDEALACGDDGTPFAVDHSEPGAGVGALGDEEYTSRRGNASGERVETHGKMAAAPSSIPREMARSEFGGPGVAAGRGRADEVGLAQVGRPVRTKRRRTSANPRWRCCRPRAAALEDVELCSGYLSGEELRAFERHQAVLVGMEDQRGHANSRQQSFHVPPGIRGAQEEVPEHRGRQRAGRLDEVLDEVAPAGLRDHVGREEAEGLFVFACPDVRENLRPPGRAAEREARAGRGAEHDEAIDERRVRGGEVDQEAAGQGDAHQDRGPMARGFDDRPRVLDVVAQEIGLGNGVRASVPRGRR